MGYTVSAVWMICEMSGCIIVGIRWAIDLHTTMQIIRCTSYRSLLIIKFVQRYSFAWPIQDNCFYQWFFMKDSFRARGTSHNKQPTAQYTHCWQPIPNQAIPEHDLLKRESAYRAFEPWLVCITILIQSSVEGNIHHRLLLLVINSLDP